LGCAESEAARDGALVGGFALERRLGVISLWLRRHRRLILAGVAAAWLAELMGMGVVLLAR